MPAHPLLAFSEHGSGPPLLFVHGLMISGKMFDEVVPHFAARHRVIVPDLRGHGGSRDLGGPYATADLASDLVRLLDRLGIASTATLGYSQGGAVAQELALDHPQRCSRLVLCCTYAFNRASLRERLEARAAPLLLRALGMNRFARIVFSTGIEGLGVERKTSLTGLIAEQDRDLMIQAWKEAMAFDSRPRLSEIRCPTLILAGSRDTAVPMHHARMLHGGISGSRLIVVAGAGHGLIWTHPRALEAAVDAFLDGRA